MNSDIQKVVQIIDQRIAKLQQAKSLLLEQFDDVPAPITSAAISIHTSSGNGNGNLTRKDQLAKFLIEHGPSTRGTINEKSGIPKGTIASLLSKDGFVRRYGKWQVAETSSSATQEITQ